MRSLSVCVNGFVSRTEDGSNVQTHKLFALWSKIYSFNVSTLQPLSVSSLSAHLGNLRLRLPRDIDPWHDAGLANKTAPFVYTGALEIWSLRL